MDEKTLKQMISDIVYLGYVGVDEISRKEVIEIIHKYVPKDIWYWIRSNIY